jgi:membrane protein implicated in regulation of membrane protease activity
MVETETLIYLTMAIIGLAFLVLAVFGGDAGADADFDADVGLDHDFSGVTPLSLPMIATFLATAGAIGSVLSYSGFDSSYTAVYAGAVGGISFSAIYLLMAKLLIPSQGSSAVYEKEYEGKTGVVTETIPAEGIGAVALTVRGSRSVVSARGTGNKIPIGTEVLIKRVADAVATVEEVRQA